MAIFLTASLFTTAMLLTHHPVSFKGRIELVAERPLRALSSGAEIEIGLPLASIDGKSRELLAGWKTIRSSFPAGTIVGYLVDEDGEAVTLTYRGYSSISNEDVRLILDSKNGISTDKSFSKVIIESDVQLNNVNIYWRNYKK